MRFAIRLAGLTVTPLVFTPGVIGQPTPAARLLPARTLSPAETPVRRSATPDYPPTATPFHYQVPTTVPAPTAGHVSRPTSTVQPPPPQQAERSNGVFSGMLSGVRNMFNGGPETAYDPALGSSAAPVATHAPVSPPPAPGTYAGPPAYRWYGYGSPTPGANPYAPTGLSPKGSASWYVQTGATPGAFPVPVRVDPPTQSYEPPTYVSRPRTDDERLLTGTTIRRSDHVPTEHHTIPEPDGRSSRAGPPVIAAVDPRQPSGTRGLADAAAPAPGALAWQPVVAHQLKPLAQSSSPSIRPTQYRESGVNWAPSAGGGASSPPAPAVSMIRGQAPADSSEDLAALIRSACFGRASDVAVLQPEENRLVVRLTTPTETDARDAAAVISRLPELRTRQVVFEVKVDPR